MKVMKVFISSVIYGYEDYRDGVAEIIEGLGYDAIRSEDFPAQPNTPQQACLQAVRESDVMVLLLGAKYGTTQPSGLSATQEEYEEAERVDKFVLVFIESNTDLDQRQKQFIDDNVKSWNSGKMLNYFSNLTDLKYKVMRSLHRLALDNSGPVDSDSLTKRIENLIEGDFTHWDGPLLLFSLAGSPKNQIIRPAMLNDYNFQQRIEQYAKEEEYSVLERNKKTEIDIRNTHLILQQSFANIKISQDGEIVIQKKLIKKLDHRDGLPVIIEERVSEHILGILQFCANMLDEIDTVRTISWIAVAVRIIGNRYTPWRTETEHKRNPNRINVGIHYKVMMPVSLKPFARLVLRKDLVMIRDDLVAVIEREVYHG